MLIVLFHYTWAYNAKAYDGGAYATDWGWSVPWGYAAVTTFFMLSGYLSGRYVYRDTPLTPRRFIRKKLWRFFPAYWTAMTLTTLVLVLFFESERPTLLQYIANLTMVSRLFGVPFIDGVYWTMQNELLFMLAAAALMCCRSPRRVDMWLWIWIAVSLALSFTTDIKALKLIRMALMANYCHTFISGLALYRIATVPSAMPRYMPLLAFCFANSALWHGLLQPDTIFFAVTAVLVATAGTIDRHTSGNNPIVRAASRVAAISYPLYLIHQMVGVTVIRHGVAAGFTHPLFILVPIALSLVAAWAIHTFVEKNGAQRVKNLMKFGRAVKIH